QADEVRHRQRRLLVFQPARDQPLRGVHVRIQSGRQGLRRSRPGVRSGGRCDHGERQHGKGQGRNQFHGSLRTTFKRKCQQEYASIGHPLPPSPEKNPKVRKMRERAFRTKGREDERRVGGGACPRVRAPPTDGGGGLRAPGGRLAGPRRSPRARRSHSGRINGNSNTSLMLGLSVSSMIMRSMPMPTPPVGGMPYSSARRKSSSRGWVSSSPPRPRSTCSS